MAETILSGYLINKINYQVFDEVITFICENGKKYTCMSLGSKKIESKNGRNLFYGNKIEFQIFEARSEEKISKLKKAVMEGNINWPLQSSNKLLVLNEIIQNMDASKKTYQFYEDKIHEINEDKEDDQTFILKILRDFIEKSGIMLEVNRCVRCGSKILKTISFKHHGMLCNNCVLETHSSSYDIRVNKLIYSLFNNQEKEINQYYDIFGFVIKLLKQYILDVSGIKLKSLVDY